MWEGGAQSSQLESGVSRPRVLILLAWLLFVVCIFSLQFGLRDGKNPAGQNSSSLFDLEDEIDCGVELPNTHFCFKGVLYHLQKGNAVSLYNLLFTTTQKPNITQRTFAPLVPGLMLEIVLIELKPAEVPRLLPTIYNIGHIYGGGSVGFTVLYNGYHSQINNRLKKEWPNVRWIQKDGNLTIPDYNRMLTSKEFFDQFQSRFMLLTHTDAMIFRPLDEDFFSI